MKGLVRDPDTGLLVLSPEAQFPVVVKQGINPWHGTVTPYEMSQSPLWLRPQDQPLRMEQEVVIVLGTQEWLMRVVECRQEAEGMAYRLERIEEREDGLST